MNFQHNYKFSSKNLIIYYTYQFFIGFRYELKLIDLFIYYTYQFFMEYVFVMNWNRFILSSMYFQSNFRGRYEVQF